MIRAKKTLIFLVLLFIVLITVFTTIRFRTVKYFTQVYSYSEWKLNENNGFRIAFLEFMNRESFLPYYLELYIVDSTGNKKILDKGKKAPELYNKEFYIENLKEGDGHILGKIKYDNRIVDYFNIPIKIISKFTKNKIKLSPRIITQASSDFKKEEKVITYPRFNKLKTGEYNINNKKDIRIQLFSSPKDFVFSERNKVFLLFTLPDYTPIKLKTKLDIKEFFSKRKELTLETDQNGIISFEENIFRSDGYIYLDNELLMNKKVPFELSNDKTAVLTNKEIYSPNEKIKINVKTYKKIDELFFNVIISNSWIKNQRIKVNKLGNEIEFIPPEDYTGFIEFNVYKGYSYLKDNSYKKVFIGDKETLKNQLLNLNDGFISKVINERRDNSTFYTLAISQLDNNKIGVNKVFDSYKLQQDKLDNDREKYQSIIWTLLLIISSTIILIIFFTSLNSIKKSQENIEYRFRKKGGVIYLYIFIVILIAFISLILWVLKIV
jgi:hypothetical protein